MAFEGGNALPTHVTTPPHHGGCGSGQRAIIKKCVIIIFVIKKTNYSILAVVVDVFEYMYVTLYDLGEFMFNGGQDKLIDYLKQNKLLATNTCSSSGSPQLNMINSAVSAFKNDCKSITLKCVFSILLPRLHVSTIPHSLPCRGDQFANILSFVEGKLLQNGSG